MQPRTEVRSRLVCDKCHHMVTVPDGMIPKAGNRCAIRVCTGKYSFVDRIDVREDEPLGRV